MLVCASVWMCLKHMHPCMLKGTFVLIWMHLKYIHI